MLSYKIVATDPDVIFRVVRNSGTVAMTPGRGVVYAYQTNGGDDNDGVGVRFGEDYYPTGFSRQLFAGVVAGRIIPPRGYGTIQVWGPSIEPIPVAIDAAITGVEPVMAEVTAAVLNDEDMAAYIWLEPMSRFVDGYTGFFVFCQQEGLLAQRDFCPQPCVAPLDAIIPDGATTYGTITYTSTGLVGKAFIRAL